MKTTLRWAGVFCLVLGVSAQATTYTLTNNAATINWNAAGNWNPDAFPNAVDDVAIIPNLGVGSQDFNLNQEIVLGTLTDLLWGHNYNAGTGGSLKMQASSGNAVLSVIGGGNHFYCPITLAGPFEANNSGYWFNTIGNPDGLWLEGPIGGSGTFHKAGISMAILTSSANTFTGTIEVAQGYLNARSDNNGVFGYSGNTITLGSQGHFGELIYGTGAGVSNNLARPITLAGCGGQLSSGTGGNPPNGMYVSGPISGPGQLILARCSGNWTRLNQTTDNTFSGGARSWHWRTDVVTTNRVYGTGPLVSQYYGTLVINDQGNFNSNLPIRVESVRTPGNPFGGRWAVLYLNNDMDIQIDTNSSGILGFSSSGPKLNALLAEGAPQVGNGYMAIGSTWGAGGGTTFTGSSLQPNKDGVYRFRCFGNSVILNNTSGDNGVLRGTNGVEISGQGDVWGGLGEVNFGAGGDTNSFTGPLVVGPGTGLRAHARPDGTGWILGHTNGAVFLRGGFIYGEVAYGGLNVLQKGPLSIESLASFRVDNWGANFTNVLKFASLTRQNRGTLGIFNWCGGTAGCFLGVNGRLMIDAGVPASINGMVAPYIGPYYWVGGSGSPWLLELKFMDYLPGAGFAYASFTHTGLSGALAMHIVDATAGASEQVPLGGVTMYALRARYPLLSNGTADKITIASGGLIFGEPPANPTVHTAPIDFGNAEGIIWFPNNSAGGHRLDGIVMAQNGITLSPTTYSANNGMPEIYLNADNSTNLFGQITVNHGLLGFYAANNLGPATNLIYLNGPTGSEGSGPAAGLHDVNGIAFDNPIEIGPCGGCLWGNGTANGKISGTGQLGFSGNGTYNINNPSNDYSGGTFINSMLVYVNGNGRLGTGPVLMGDWGSVGRLILQGTNGVAPDARVSMIGDYGACYEYLGINASPIRFGSLEGFGNVLWGNPGPQEFSVGQNNDSTEFFGYFINNHGNWEGDRFVKAGTGTFTFWGDSNLRASCTNSVQEGTLMLNGQMNGTVEVAGGAILAGNGIAYGPLNVLPGGKVVPGYNNQGVLDIVGSASFDSTGSYDVTLAGPNATVDFAQMAVTGAINLNGAALDLTLTFAPAIGQSFLLMDNPLGTTISGQFDGGTVASATYLGRTYSFAVHYAAGDGNDIMLDTLAQGTAIFIR